MSREWMALISGGTFFGLLFILGLWLRRMERLHDEWLKKNGRI